MLFGPTWPLLPGRLLGLGRTPSLMAVARFLARWTYAVVDLVLSDRNDPCLHDCFDWVWTLTGSALDRRRGQSTGFRTILMARQLRSILCARDETVSPGTTKTSDLGTRVLETTDPLTSRGTRHQVRPRHKKGNTGRQHWASVFNVCLHDKLNRRFIKKNALFRNTRTSLSFKNHLEQICISNLFIFLAVKHTVKNQQ